MLAALAASGCAIGDTGAPTSIAPTSAEFVGKVVSDSGGAVEYWAQYGTTTAYGSETAHQTVDTEVNTPVTVRGTIGGLQRSTTYHYRLCASDSQQRGGPGCGRDRRFTTQSVGCGETVTTDIALTGDLVCDQGGFVIGADGVDINLAGHSMSGVIFSGGGGPIGIDNSGGFDDLTVRNGSLGAWGFAVETDGGSRNRVLNVTAGAAGNAVTIDGGTGNEVRRSDLFGRSFGLRSTGSTNLIVAGTSAAGGFGSGIEVSGNGARIVRNRTVTGGVSTTNISGIRLIGSGGRVAANHVEGPWPAGGISIFGTNNTVVDNTVLEAAPLFPTSMDSDGDGIFVGAGSSGTVLKRNRADRNEGDGIDVNSAGVRLGDNAAFDNGGWGIDAVSGVIDLGGNTAGGNGQAGQCRNVFCP